MKKISLVFAVFFAIKLSAQDIQINEPTIITQMTERWAEINRSDTRIEGWRIQIFSTTDRKKVEEAKTDFLSKFPDLPADWVQEKPYYKLRVGAFFTKMEAIGLQHDLQADYPSAYPTKDRTIRPRDFLEMR